MVQEDGNSRFRRRAGRITSMFLVRWVGGSDGPRWGLIVRISTKIGLADVAQREGACCGTPRPPRRPTSDIYSCREAPHVWNIAKMSFALVLEGRHV